MATFVGPRQIILSNTGSPISGGKAYTYLTGTSTPKATYQNEALSTPHANPVVADAAGRLAGIYLNTDAAYKIVYTDASGNVLHTDDPVRPVPLYTDFSTIVTHAYRAANSPIRYGAAGDGVTDDSAAVQSAITNASGTVDLLGLTYRCDSQVTVPSNRRIVNGTLDFTNCSATDGYIKATGSASSAQAASAVAANSITLTSTATPPASAVANALIAIRSEELIGGVTGRGEFARILSVSGTTINLRGPTGELDYTTTPTYRVITPVTNLEFSGLKIIGSASGTKYGIYLTYCDGVTIKNCEFLYTATAHVMLINSVNVKLDTIKTIGSLHAVYVGGCDSVTVDKLEAATLGNGVTITGSATLNMICSRVRVVESTIRSHLTTSSGVSVVWPARAVDVCGAFIEGFQYGVSASVGADLLIADNVIRKFNTYGVYVEVPNTITSRNLNVHSNRMESDTSGSSCVYLTNNSVGGGTVHGVRIANNSLSPTGGGYGVLLDLTKDTAEMHRVMVVGNTVYAPAGSGVALNVPVSALTCTVRQVHITNNAIELTESGASYGIQVLRRHVNSTIKGVVVAGNAVYLATGGVLVESCDEVVVANNDLRTITTDGIKAYNDLAATNTGLAISGNIINNPTTGIQVAASLSASSIVTDVAISGNVMTGVTSRGVFLNATNSGLITNIALNGNVTVCDGDTQAAIDATCVNANDITNVSATGNVAYNGAYGLRFSANCTVVVAAANAGASLATGGVSGADTVDGTNNPV